jgi:hypothetical protein
VTVSGDLFIRPAVLLVSLLLAGCGSSECAFEKFYNSPHIRISQTPWVVDIWGHACGFGVSGGMEIRAVNESTQETKTIATFGDMVVDLTLSSDEPKLLTVKLPNLVDIADQATRLDSVRIVYKFTPNDDPEARANFQQWTHHPDDPPARDWYCHNILAKMDPTNRATWNAIIGQSYPADHAAEHKYCPER